MRIGTLGAVIALTLIAADPGMAQSSVDVGGSAPPAVPVTRNVGDDIQATLNAGKIPPTGPFGPAPKPLALAEAAPSAGLISDPPKAKPSATAARPGNRAAAKRKPRPSTRKKPPAPAG